MTNNQYTFKQLFLAQWSWKGLWNTFVVYSSLSFIFVGASLILSDMCSGKGILDILYVTIVFTSTLIIFFTISYNISKFIVMFVMCSLLWYAINYSKTCKEDTELYNDFISLYNEALTWRK